MTGRLSASAWRFEAEWAISKAGMAHINAAVEDDKPVREGNPWRRSLHNELARIERLRAAAYEQYAEDASAVAVQAASEEMTRTLTSLPNTVAVPGRTLADQVREDGLRAARHDEGEVA